jgi:zinc transport system substrate-binding protein
MMTVVLVAGSLVSLAACGGSGGGGGTDDGRLQVVAAFYPVAEAATQIGGDRVQVHNLTPAGTEPHDLELSPRQVDELEAADVVAYLGRGFQPSVEKLARRHKGSVDLLSGITLHRGASEDAVDPHFWLDPRRMATAVGEITAAFAKAAPADAAGFRTAAARYDRQLTALDGEFEQGLATCARHEIVTAHAAFFYMAQRYHLTQLAISGLSPETEPDPARLATLTDTIKAKGITTVFYEELVSPAVARTLAREAGVSTAVLSPIEGLTKKQLDAGEDYVTVMRANLAALRKALDCR